MEALDLKVEDADVKHLLTIIDHISGREYSLPEKEDWKQLLELYNVAKQSDTTDLANLCKHRLQLGLGSCSTKVLMKALEGAANQTLKFSSELIVEMLATSYKISLNKDSEAEALMEILSAGTDSDAEIILADQNFK